jgi:heme-degrading monooxygenase HmoA
MYARVARYRFPEERHDEAVEAFRRAGEGLRDIDGNAGGYLLVDRDNCTALTVVFWKDRVAMEASEVHTSRLRSEAINTVEGEIQTIDRCEIALDFAEIVAQDGGASPTS